MVIESHQIPKTHMQLMNGPISTKNEMEKSFKDFFVESNDRNKCFVSFPFIKCGF